MQMLHPEGHCLSLTRLLQSVCQCGSRSVDQRASASFEGSLSIAEVEEEGKIFLKELSLSRPRSERSLDSRQLSCEAARRSRREAHRTMIVHVVGVGLV